MTEPQTFTIQLHPSDLAHAKQIVGLALLIDALPAETAAHVLTHYAKSEQKMETET